MSEFESLSAKIADFKRMVIAPVFPNVEFSSAGGMTSQNADFKRFDAQVSVNGQAFNDSLIEYKGENKFLHFTSIQNCISILRSESLRMYDFNNMNDRLELIHANRYYPSSWLPANISGAKSECFSLSLCEYSQQLLENDINMWRLYGANGKGVCLILELDRDAIKKYLKYALAKVQYSPTGEGIQAFDQMVVRAKDFAAAHDFECTNIYDILTPMCAFYKNDLFKIENEVRLLRIIKKTSGKYDSDDVKGDISASGDRVNYIEVPINCFEDSSVPCFKVTGIDVGYMVNPKAYQAFGELVFELDVSYPSCRWSPLRKKLGIM
jgi:Protein of unknown function (DUF2971)